MAKTNEFLAQRCEQHVFFPNTLSIGPFLGFLSLRTSNHRYGYILKASEPKATSRTVRFEQI